MEKEKIVQFKIDHESKEPGTFTGYASTFDNVDRDGDIIFSTAFDDFLADDLNKSVPLLYGHKKNLENMLGKIELEKDAHGLFGRGKLDLSTDLGKRTYNLMKMGALNSLSIGFLINDYEPVDPQKPFGGWKIKSADLTEVSVVITPANPKAKITQVKEKKAIMDKQNLINEEKGCMPTRRRRRKDFEGDDNMATTLAELNELRAKINDNLKHYDDIIEKDGEESLTKDDRVEISSLTKQLADIDEQIEIEELAVQKFKKANTMRRSSLVNSAQKDYLKSKESMEDFAEVIRQNAGGTLQDVNKAWKKKLVEKGITNADVLLPQPVVEAINDAFEASGRIFGTFRRVFGVYAWSSAINNSLDTAQGYTPYDTSTTPPTENAKKEQSVSLEVRTIQAQEIYKYIRIPRKYIKMTGRILLDYILRELPMHVIRILEKAAIIGCPELTGEDAITSFIPIKGDATPYVNVITPTANSFIDLMNAVASITAPGPIYVVCSKAYLNGIRQMTDTTGQFIFPPGTDLAMALGVAAIFTPDWMTAADGAVVYAGDSYHYVGDGAVEEHRNFILQYNAEEFLAEIMGAGALMLPNSGATIAQYLP